MANKISLHFLPNFHNLVQKISIHTIDVPKFTFMFFFLRKVFTLFADYVHLKIKHNKLNVEELWRIVKHNELN